MSNACFMIFAFLFSDFPPMKKVSLLVLFRVSFSVLVQLDEGTEDHCPLTTIYWGPIMGTECFVNTISHISFVDLARCVLLSLFCRWENKLRQVTWLGQTHTTGKWQSQDLIQTYLTQTFMCFLFYHYSQTSGEEICMRWCHRTSSPILHPRPCSIPYTLWLNNLCSDTDVLSFRLSPPTTQTNKDISSHCPQLQFITSLFLVGVATWKITFLPPF